MMRTLALGALTTALASCAVTGNGRWRAWEEAERQPLGRATVDRRAQVVENPVRWLGPSDLHAEILMTPAGSERLSVVARIADDRPLQQPRPASVQPAWWLQRVGADAMEITVGEGEAAFSVIAALGSAGIGAEIIQGEAGDAVDVRPTPTGAEVQMLVDLGARGMRALGMEAPVRVRLHDADGPGDWSVHEVTLR